MSKLNIITKHETEVDAEGNPVKLDKADQYYEGRPTVTLSDGNTYEYHPWGIDAPQLVGNQLNHERQAESDAAWLESCSPLVKLNFAKEVKIDANRFVAGQKISGLYNDKTGEGLDIAQRNDLMVASLIQRKELSGTASTEESAMLDLLEEKALLIAAIRAAENATADIIMACTTIEEVNAVVEPAWPL